MKYIETNWDIPYYNLALEEYLLTEMPPDDYLFFYVHKPSVIIGRHQNTVEEVNADYAEANDITVARRLSGGGAVYHDSGNLNFSFVFSSRHEEMRDFTTFTRPVINALTALGICAELSGRNDILIDGMKFSGNAQAIIGKRLLHHGTLLFDTGMDNLAKVLQVHDLKIESKSIKSVKSRVTNIRPHLKSQLSISDLKEHLTGYFDQEYTLSSYALTEKDIAAVEARVQSKFGTWEWNWGHSPAYDIRRTEKFPCGIIDIMLHIQRGRISQCKIYGDFFSRWDVGELENHLAGLDYNKDALTSALLGFPLDDFFDGMTATEFAQFLLG